MAITLSTNRIFCVIALIMLPTFQICSDEGKGPLQFLECDVKDVLQIYSKMTNRKVWVTLDLRAYITFRAEGAITRAEAVRLLRTTLLERYGIEIRDSGDKEAFATWSDDPKYKEIRGDPNKSKIGIPRIPGEFKERVKSIEPGKPQK